MPHLDIHHIAVMFALPQFVVTGKVFAEEICSIKALCKQSLMPGMWQTSSCLPPIGLCSIFMFALEGHVYTLHHPILCTASCSR